MRRIDIRTLLRHQLGAIAATALDFVVMIALVSGRRVTPALGAAGGAAVGAATNFALGRAWVFPAHRGSGTGQALRYALVSLVSLLLNSAGEHLLATVLHIPYVAARVLVAASVSLAWNYPMHRHVVFRHQPARGDARTPPDGYDGPHG